MKVSLLALLGLHVSNWRNNQTYKKMGKPQPINYIDLYPEDTVYTCVNSDQSQAVHSGSYYKRSSGFEHATGRVLKVSLAIQIISKIFTSDIPTMQDPRLSINSLHGQMVQIPLRLATPL
jgi:hypothetical protein